MILFTLDLYLLFFWYTFGLFVCYGIVVAWWCCYFGTHALLCRPLAAGPFSSFPLVPLSGKSQAK
jgi:hypothetical protein